MESQIFGRDQEKKLFRKIYQSKEAAFIAVYGRRRVGKTYLVKEFFKDKGLFFHLTGLKDEKAPMQLRGFAREFGDVFCEGKVGKAPKNWSEALNELRCAVEKVSINERVVLFFDELPWLASPKSGFLSALDHLWNRYLSSMPNVILVICGSAASWMIKRVINDKGGLHGRITHEIPLFPFTLEETQGYLEGRNIFLKPMQLTELYMAIGGVAKYLTYIERGFSAAELINQLCFTRRGPLTNEFHRLYQSLFTHYESHIAIVRALSRKRLGMGYRELAKAAAISPGGTFTQKLQELKMSGFIDTMAVFGKGKRERRYVLVDEYSLFYLTWMEGSSVLEMDETTANYWLRQRETPKWTAWKGYAFERMCLKHLKGIKEALGISAILTKTSKWSCRPKDPQDRGAEIDWVMERDDGCIHLFEAKYVADDFEIDKEEARRLRNKRTVFQRETQTRKTLFTTFITPYGVKENSYYADGVDQQVILEKLLAVGAKL